jgi:hypothetical protein
MISTKRNVVGESSETAKAELIIEAGKVENTAVVNGSF